MSRMTDGRKAFVLSLVLHGLVIVGLLVSTLWQYFAKPPPPTHVFQLYQPVPDAPQQPSRTPPQSQPDPQPALQVPKMPELDEREVKIPEPQPEPPPQPKPKPQPKPETPKPQPKPKPVEQPKTIDFSQFAKEHGAPKPTAAPKPKQPKVNTPKLDISDIKRDLQKNLSAEDNARFNQMSSAQQSLLMDYHSRIRAIIDANFEQPTGLYQRFVASVSFQIGRDGTISNVRIARSSGSNVFDEAAVETFRRIGRFPAPPSGALSLRIDFKTEE